MLLQQWNQHDIINHPAEWTVVHCQQNVDRGDGNSCQNQEPSEPSVSPECDIICTTEAEAVQNRSVMCGEIHCMLKHFLNILSRKHCIGYMFQDIVLGINDIFDGLCHSCF